MRKAPFTVAIALATCIPSSAFAWGISAHRFIMTRAIDLLPPPLKPFFDHVREEVVLRVIDPDLWRTVGWEEDRNHFLDFGVPEYGPYPFMALPREYGAAIEKFGMTTLARNGLLPWRAAEEFGNLRRAFEGFARGSPYAPHDTALFAAIVAHYVQDARQPFHATNNYDGQLTGQTGLHARFESDLFDLFQSRMMIEAARPVAVTSPRDAIFDSLLSGHQLVQPLLDGDKRAVAGKDTYDDEYYEKFFASARQILERRLSESITTTAAFIIGAWEQAGKPTPQIKLPRTIQKVRSPK